MKVIIMRVNIKLWDILGCFHYILNAPRKTGFRINIEIYEDGLCQSGDRTLYSYIIIVFITYLYEQKFMLTYPLW